MPSRVVKSARHGQQNPHHPALGGANGSKQARVCRTPDKNFGFRRAWPAGLSNIMVGADRAAINSVRAGGELIWTHDEQNS